MTTTNQNFDLNYLWSMEPAAIRHAECRRIVETTDIRTLLESIDVASSTGYSDEDLRAPYVGLAHALHSAITTGTYVHAHIYSSTPDADRRWEVKEALLQAVGSDWGYARKNLLFALRLLVSLCDAQ